MIKRSSLSLQWAFILAIFYIDHFSQTQASPHLPLDKGLSETRIAITPLSNTRPLLSYGLL